tara:strand:+ start:3832 stop:5469 length:1638 start_codon:yes stop_codon:yes gene_type:complete
MNTTTEYQEDNVLKGIANKVEKIAWLIEFSIIGVGLLVSILLTFNKGSDAPIGVILPGLLFFGLLAMAELAKIPLSQTFVATSSKITKVGSLLVLLIVSFLTAETLIMAGSIVQKARLDPILDKKITIERNMNAVHSIEQKIKNLTLGSSALNDELTNATKLEIQDLNQQIIQTKNEVDGIIKSNGSIEKQSIRDEIARVSEEIRTSSTELIALKNNFSLEEKQLHELKIEEMDRSILGKRSISRNYEERIEKRREAFMIEKNELEDVIGLKRMNLIELGQKLLQASKMTPNNKILAEGLGTKIEALEKKIRLTNSEQKSQTSAYFDKELSKESQQKSMLNDLGVMQVNLADSKTQLNKLYRDHFIYQLCGYIFQKDATEVSDDEYAFFNLVFIFSIAIGLSILPSFLAGLSIALRLDRGDQERATKSESFFNRIKEVLDSRDAGDLEKYKFKNQQAEQKINQLMEEKASANLNYQKIHKENEQLQKELKKKPTIVYKDKVEYVDKPVYTAVPMPEGFEGGSSATTMIDFFNSIFSPKQRTSHEQ